MYSRLHWNDTGKNMGSHSRSHTATSEIATSLSLLAMTIKKIDHLPTFLNYFVVVVTVVVSVGVFIGVVLLRSMLGLTTMLIVIMIVITIAAMTTIKAATIINLSVRGKATAEAESRLLFTERIFVFLFFITILFILLFQYSISVSRK